MPSYLVTVHLKEEINSIQMTIKKTFRIKAIDEHTATHKAKIFSWCYAVAARNYGRNYLNIDPEIISVQRIRKRKNAASERCPYTPDMFADLLSTSAQ